MLSALLGLSLGLWLAFATLVVPTIIESAYHGKSWRITNSLIQGQGIHPLSHYLEDWSRFTQKSLLVGLAVWMLVLVVTSPSFTRKSALWIDVARVGTIIAAVAVLYSPTVASAALITTYVAFVASGQALLRFKQVFQRPSVYWGLVFLAVVLIGVTYASVPWPDRWIDVYTWRTMLWFFVVLSIFDEERWKIRLMVVFILVAAVGLVVSFVTATGCTSDAILQNRVTQGMGFALAAVVCLWMIMENTLSKRMRWMVTVLGPLFVANVVFISIGRSGYVILGLGFAVLLLWKASPLQQLVIALGLPIAAVLAFSISPCMRDRIISGVNEWTQYAEKTSMGTRRALYVNTLEILEDHWLFGLGTGGFRQAYIEHVAKKYGPRDWRADPHWYTSHPHNQYLGVLAEHGIGGLAAFFAWIVAIARDKVGPPACRKLALAILCGWCVTSLFHHKFEAIAEGYLLMTFLGALLAAAPLQNRVAQRRTRPSFH